jgi:pimeloyl-ACP methyl ester carboxylesterase
VPDAGREETLAAGHLRLACRLWGEAHGVPTLALHGWLDNAASFDVLAPLLPRLRLCALDLPGHGRSEHRPAGVAYHFVDYVGDVLAAADALEWPRFVLIGHSLGAGIATLIAAIAPERVTRAVLIEGLGPQASPPGDAPATLRRVLADQQRVERARPATYASVDDAVAARMGGIGGLSEPAARVLCARGLDRVASGFAWRSDRRLRGGSRLRLSEDHVLAFIRAMAVPTLLVRAEPGLGIDEAAFAQRVAAHPDLRVARLPGSHHVHMEDPAPVARLIEGFLDG